MRDIKRIVSILLAGCIIITAAGCNKQPEVDVRPVCEAFFADVKEGNASKLITYFDSSDTTVEDLNSIINPSGLNEEQNAYLDAIRKTNDFTVQDPVYDYEAKTATVFVSFYQADYLASEVKAAKDFESYESALSSVPNKIQTLNVTVDFSGETQKIVDPKVLIDTVYAFTSAENNVMPGKLKDYCKNAEFVLAPERIYTNAKEIGIRVTFDKALFGYSFVPGIRYYVLKGNDPLYTSDVMEITEEVVRLDLTREMAGDSSYNENGFLTEGIYTFKVTDDRDNEIISLNCRVQTKTYEKETVAFKNLKNDYYLSNLVFDFKDEDMKTNVYEYKSGWWDYDGTSIGKSAFGSNTKTLGFSLAVNSDITGELYYDYFYSKDADFKGINLEQPLSSASCKPSAYEDQTCYNLDYSSEKFEPGFYGIVVYSDASKTHIVMTAACIVVKESSTDIKGT